MWNQIFWNSEGLGLMLINFEKNSPEYRFIILTNPKLGGNKCTVQ